MKGGRDRGPQGGVRGIGDRTVSLPKDVAVGSGEQDIGVVRRGEIDEFFPVVLMIEKRDEVRMLRGGNVLAHAVDDHAANHSRGVLQFRELIDGDVRIVGGKVGGEALAPGGRLLAAFVREADGEDEVLLAAGFREHNFGIVERFALDGWDGLGIQRRHSEKNERENPGRKFDHGSH